MGNSKGSVQHYDWSAPVSNDVAYRRAGGRRGYNARRRFQAAYRRVQVSGLLLAHHPAEIARILGVHRATITRDIQALQDAASKGRCPTCGAEFNSLWMNENSEFWIKLYAALENDRQDSEQGKPVQR